MGLLQACVQLHGWLPLCNRLRGHSGRLLTLVGPPGIGKTRLGLAMAARLQRHYPDGAVFVPLAAVTDPAVMASTIALAVGSDDASAKPPTVRLIEQIVGAAPLIVDVLAACPGLCMLATSRERLHLRAEQRYRVPPLDMASALELFAQRAAAVEADFVVTAANRPTIEAICQALDRLPLALELCAAQVDLLSPTQILARLQERRLDLLVDGAHDLPPQHRTLRNAIQRSYDLLADDERVLFRCMGVFVGGCDLEALEAVSTWREESCPRSLLSTLHALVGKSLVRAETLPPGEQCFTMLETIREYALEQLEVSGEAEQLRRQHALYYLALSEEGWPGRGPEGHSTDDRTWVRHIDREYNNLRSALAWSQTSADDSEVALRLAGVLTDLWYHRGVRGEGIALLERTLNHPLGVGRTASHAQARVDLALLFGLTGDFAAARAQYEEVLALSRELGDTQLCAYILERLGWVAREQGDSATAWLRMMESLAIFRDLGDAAYTASTLASMAGIAILEEDPARAEALLAESRAVAQEGDENPYTIFWRLNHLGHAAQLRGAYDGAAQLHQESLALLPTDVSPGAAELAAYRDLGETAVGLGRPDEAVRWLAQGLAASCMLGEQPFTAWCLASLGSAAALDEDAERAARLWGAAEQLRQAIGCRPAPAARATYERAQAAARAQLGEEAFAAAWAEGREMTLEHSIAEALAVADMTPGQMHENGK